MIKTRMIGILLACLPIPGLCLSDLPKPTASLAYTQSRGNSLYLAAVDEQPTPAQAGLNQAATPTPDQLEFPHLDLPSTPDWDGLMHDSKLFILYQVGVVGVLYFMPQSVSQWGDNQKNGNVFRKWNDNVNSLRTDHDKWEVNYIGHPYFGSVYYVRARERGFDRKGSLWYAITMSTIYEYGIEAIFEPASVQDLIFTPVGGAVVGEYFMTARENIMRDVANKGYATTGDNLRLFFTDPLGAVNRKVDKIFGHKEANLDLMPLFSHDRTDQHSLPTLVGLQAHVSW